MSDRPKKHTVVAQEWEVSERGWGCHADGFSLHLTQEARDAYVKKEYEGRSLHKVPDVYTRTCGLPFSVAVNDATFERINKSPGKVVWVDKL